MKQNPASLVERYGPGLKRSLLAAAALRHRPGARRVALLLASVAFLIGLILSLRATPDLLGRVEWRPALAVTVLVIPFSLLLNAVDFGLIARIAGRSIGFRSSLEVTVVGSAANLLPLPGAAMARISALKLAGSTFKDGTYVTVLSGLWWLAFAMLYSGGWAAHEQEGELALALLGLGVPLGAIVTVALRRLRAGWKILGLLAGTKVALAAVDALTLYLCLAALGFSATFAEASVLTVSGPAGSMALVLPGGLGIREGAAAFVGSVVGLPAAAGFLSASLARILGIGVIFPVSAWLATSARGAQDVERPPTDEPATRY